jgi:Uncharacterized conserved protein (DUF2203)
MARDENETSPGRVFSLLEANQLIPQLQLHLSTVREGKSVLMRTREEANKASANACFGGGTPVGVSYVQSLQDISANLHAIHELGVVVKSWAVRLPTYPRRSSRLLMLETWRERNLLVARSHIRVRRSLSHRRRSCVVPYFLNQDRQTAPKRTAVIIRHEIRYHWLR